MTETPEPYVDREADVTEPSATFRKFFNTIEGRAVMDRITLLDRRIKRLQPYVDLRGVTVEHVIRVNVGVGDGVVDAYTGKARYYTMDGRYIGEGDW